MVLITETGIIIKSTHMGENDKRIVLLTANSGKITAFASNAAKPKSKFLGKLEPFYFGEFTINCNQNSNRINEVNITHYFHELRTDFDAMCLGSYFLEVCDSLTYEFNEDKELLKLLFVSLKALYPRKMDLELVRAVFEIRCAAISGEFYFDEGQYPDLKAGTYQAMGHIMNSPLSKLYLFTLSEEIRKQIKVMAKIASKVFPGGYKSLNLSNLS